MMPVFGALSNKYGRRRVYVFGTAAMTLFAYPFFLMLGTGSVPVVLLAFIIGNGDRAQR